MICVFELRISFTVLLAFDCRTSDVRERAGENNFQSDEKGKFYAKKLTIFFKELSSVSLVYDGVNFLIYVYNLLEY